MILGFLPSGLKGLSIAALTAAIVASLAGKVNSISTIFTLDVFKKYFDQNATEKKLVWIGRITVVTSMVIALFFNWEDLLGIGGEGGFKLIQKYQGFISPGVCAIFILGIFWKRTTGATAIAGIITGFALSVFFNGYAPSIFGNDTIFYTAFPNGKGAYEIPFHNCMGLSFFFTMVVMVMMSLGGSKVNPKAFAIDRQMFRVSQSTLALIFMTLLILTALYVKFW